MNRATLSLSRGLATRLMLIMAASANATLHAAPLTWIGGNAPWDASSANWNPADEPDLDDEAIFNTPNSVDLAMLNQIQALTMSAGIDLDTNGFDLTVDGLVSVSGSGTNLIVSGNASQLQADSVTITNGGTIRISGGTILQIDEGANTGIFNIGTGGGAGNTGTLIGNGTIDLGDAVAPTATLLMVDGGTLTATSDDVLIDPFGQNAATLTINITDADARIDLDNGINPSVNVNRNDTLDINGQSHTSADPFSGTINLAAGSTIDMSVAWEMGTGGTINANTAGIFLGTKGATATIAGAAFTMNGGTIDLDDIDTLQFSAPFQANGGSINNSGHVIFNANSTITAGASFTMPSADSSITVNAGVTVNIDDADFNADGSGSATNVITINAGGVLDLDLGVGADTGLSGTTNLNGGELDVTTDDDQWLINGNVNVGANTGTSQINGEAVTFSSGTITVGQNATLDVNASSTTWSTNGHLVVNAGGVARFDTTTTFFDPGSFTGSGTLMTGGAVNVNAVTTINMPSGTVDLDGADLVGNTVAINQNLVINAATMDSFGDNVPIGTNVLQLNNAANLTVNLTDPNAEWTLTAQGELDINTLGGMLGGGGIQGSDFNMAGAASISGNSIWNARTDISGTVTIAAASSLNLRGGDLTSANVNRLEGGTINGAGAVNALANEGLFGFGTIDADIDFATNTELRADNGILTISGPILDMGVLGTADTDGILNRPAAWNTATNIGQVDMRGGEIRGGTITNGNVTGINGFGLLAARVINNTSINARHGGTLIVETAANDNDWDGAGGAGQLNAVDGSLELRDNLNFGFTGTVLANGGHRVFANGFALDFNPGSTIQLNNGSYESTNSTDIGGTVQVGAGGGTIKVQINRFLDFESTSTTTLNGDLQLVTNNGIIRAGATFSGTGALNIPSGSFAGADDAANVNVLIDNDGTFHVGALLDVGRVDVRDYQQSATGTLDVDLAGTGLNEFDRLLVSGAAALDGALDLRLLMGFVPPLGQTFNILSATGGVSGQFDTVDQPAALLAAGRTFDVVYTPTLVQLVVAGLITGDYNENGVVDAADYVVWRDMEGQMGPGLAADGNGDNTVNNLDYDLWRANFGLTSGAGAAASPGAAAVPEPATALLLISGLLLLCARCRD